MKVGKVLFKRKSKWIKLWTPLQGNPSVAVKRKNIYTVNSNDNQLKCAFQSKYWTNSEWNSLERLKFTQVAFSLDLQLTEYALDPVRVTSLSFVAKLISWL